MILLTATNETQEPDDELDFDEGVSIGEIVEPDMLCDRNRFLQWPGADCSCGRAFIGMASRKRTTTAKIVDVDITISELRALVADQNSDATRREVNGLADNLVEYGQQLPLGTVCRIWRYQIEIRDADDLGEAP